MDNIAHDKALPLRPAWFFPVGLALLALLLRLATLAIWPFDGLYGQDPYFYDGYARDLWSAIVSKEPLPRSYWPVGCPLIVALALPLAGFASAAGQWVSLVAGGMVAVLVYLLAKELLISVRQPETIARPTALIAGLLAGVSGQLCQSSIVTMSDAPALFWATLSAWALVRYTRLRRLGWLLLTAFALAWATITRWEYVLLAFPFALYLGFRPAVCKHWRHLMPATLLGLVVLLPQFALLSAFPRGPGGPAADGWSILNALRREFTTGAGFDIYTWPTGLFYAKPVLSPGYLLPLFTPALVIGLLLVLRRRQWQIMALLAGWALVMYVLLVGLPYQSFRYALVYLPPVMILTAIGLHWVAARVPGRWRRIAQGAIAFGLACMAIWGVYRTGELIRGWQADKDVVRWAARQMPAGATLFSHGLTLIAQHDTLYQVYDFYELTSGHLAQLTSDDSPDYVLVDPQFLETQWAGRAPAENYHWLRDGPGLDKLGEQGGYTLFGVRLSAR
jgi:4-amino-4-deoxy-L-arabinose transferase-like glycosyltransferase